MTTEIDFANSKVAVISGGSRGLGEAMARQLLSEGYRVATFSRSSSDFINEMSEKDPEEKVFLWRSVDLAEGKGMREFADLVAKHFGRIDVLVNNAAVLLEGLLTMTSDADIERLFSINVMAPILLTKACIRHMMRARAGVVLNISSINSVRGHKGVSIYTATKSAIDGFMRSLAREYGPSNIRVNSLAPGFFASDLTSYLNDNRREQILKRTPLGRVSEVSDVVDMASFLCGDRSSSVTGQIFVIDGGMTC